MSYECCRCGDKTHGVRFEGEIYCPLCLAEVKNKIGMLEQGLSYSDEGE